MTHEDYINKGILNISKNRKFPTYRETRGDRDKSYADQSDGYFCYDLKKSEVGKYLNTWFIGHQSEHSRNSKKFVSNDEIITIKKTDDDTSCHLYDRQINPIKIRIVCPTGAKFKQNEKGEDLYEMISKICSIDDSSYGVCFLEKTFTELEEIRVTIMKWLNTKKEVNGDEFLKFCISVGADESTIDYS